MVCLWYSCAFLAAGSARAAGILLLISRLHVPAPQIRLLGAVVQLLKGYVFCCCRDNAIHLVSDHIPPMTISDRRAALIAASNYLLAHGKDCRL